MDRNLIIAIILSTLVMLLFFSPAYQQRFGTEVPVQQTVEPETPPTVSPEIFTPAPAFEETESGGVASILEDDTATAPASEAVPGVSQINRPETTSVLELGNPDLAVGLSTAGGVFTHATMQRFAGPNSDSLAQLVTPGTDWNQLVILSDSSTLDVSTLDFNVDTFSQDSVVLTADLSDGRRITRTYDIDPEGFMIHCGLQLDGPWGDPTVIYAWNGPVNITEAPIKRLRIWPLTMLMRDDTTTYDKLAYLGQGDRVAVNGADEKTSRVYIKDGSQKVDAGKHKQPGMEAFTGDLEWFASRNKYFMTAAIPHENKRWHAVANYEMSGTQKWYRFTISKRMSDGDLNLDIYTGPISYDTLRSYDHDLTELMELSWRFIRPVSIAFLWLLKKLHMFIPNWGLVVVAFAIIIKIVLYPLSHKSIVSMRKMSALQPQIAELREKHKNNPQKLNLATMELYRSEGVNPLGGCLPLLLQMPVFFALYPVVGRAFELRQATFIPMWLDDLSRPDPFYILPVAMGISTFLQSKQTMTDPNQKTMLYVMPAMMVLLFANFSAGLTLYWFLFNVLTYLQQTYHR